MPDGDAAAGADAANVGGSAGSLDYNGGAAGSLKYDIVPVSEKPFKSLPLFLPSNVAYDASTNTVSAPTHRNRNEDNDGGSFSDGEEDEEQLVLVPNAGFDLLSSVNKPISCVSMVGPYRTGKSLLLARFLRDSKAFQVGPTLEGCTRGIWISTSAIRTKNESGDDGDDCYTFLLDCEGTGDVLEGSDSSNARIALTCILISSTFVFNCTGRPDRGSLQFLSYLDTVRRRLPATVGGWNNRNFPAFLWVFRDFFLRLPPRKDTGKPYTLREYMLERVLVKSSSSRAKSPKSGEGADDAVIDSLLTDFRSFDVTSIGYPRRGDEPFSPEELSTLDAVPWDEFNEEFRSDVENTIEFCLANAPPFRFGGGGSADLGPVAHGPLFASWCQRVTELVNSEEIIPNLPDLQHRLIQTLADEKVEKCVTTYSAEMDKYLSSCPIVNNGWEIGMIDFDDFEPGGGVAEEADLLAESTVLLDKLCNDLRDDITSKSILESSVDKLQTRCVTDDRGGSIYAHLLEINARRSRASCDALARNMYAKFRATVRGTDETSMTEEEFDTSVADIESKFRSIARGPAVDETVANFLREQVEADRVFLEKVNGISALYRETLQMKEKLDKDVQEKEVIVNTLQKDLEDTNVKHAEEVQRINEHTKEEMERLNTNHVHILDEAIAKQKSIEAANVAKLRNDAAEKLRQAEEKRVAELERKKAEMEAIKTDAERRLADEVAARDERLRKEEKAHEDEIRRLLENADEKMTKEIMEAEKKRKADQIKFRNEMDSKLKDAENRMNEEVQKREERLREEERKHREELERVRTELSQKMEKERREYLAEIDKLEKQCLKCCMM